MEDSKIRRLVKDHIRNYYRVTNMRSLGVSEDSIEAQVTGSGEALINAVYWKNKPSIHGNELQKYKQAIELVNCLLITTPEGMEEFNARDIP